MSGLLLTPEGMLGSLLAVGTFTLAAVWAVDFVQASYEPAVVQVESGGTAKLHGTFRSPWKETVTVKHVVAGCSCSRADVTPRQIAPGALVEVDAVFDSTGKPPGDDLSNIALRAYGDMSCWQSLLNENTQVGSRPRFRLETGETLTIPEYGKLDRRLPKSVFPKSLPADYIVMPGDSLHFIAKGCYGDRELWPLIYEANRDTLSERVKRDTRKLVAGQVLHIPARPAAAPAAAESTPP